MRVARGMAVGLLGLVATSALAELPREMLPPQPREVALSETTAPAVAEPAPMPTLRPAPRPAMGVARRPAPRPASAAEIDAVVKEVVTSETVAEILQGRAPEQDEAEAAPPRVSALAVAVSLRPEPRPRGFARLVAAATAPVPLAPSRGGSVCGVKAIKGAAVKRINGRGSCGIDQPVRVTSVSGVTLKQPPTIDCRTAKALNTWVRDGIIPAVGRTGGGVAQVRVIASYSCRTRNSKPGARLSEHAFGHAVDVSGVVLRDGTKLTVLDHWRSSRYGKILKAMHRAACGTFGTVLGPNADRYHQDHFHLDTARYRSGAYCR